MRAVREAGGHRRSGALDGKHRRQVGPAQDMQEGVNAGAAMQSPPGLCTWHGMSSWHSAGYSGHRSWQLGDICQLYLGQGRRTSGSAASQGDGAVVSQQVSQHLGYSNRGKAEVSKGQMGQEEVHGCIQGWPGPDGGHRVHYPGCLPYTRLRIAQRGTTTVQDSLSVPVG